MIFLVSCRKNEIEEIIPDKNDCIYENMDVNKDSLTGPCELYLIAECGRNEFTTKDSIEKNLLGEWRLIAYDYYWEQSDIPACGYLKVSESELTFQFMKEGIDTVYTHQWEIEKEINVQNFYLKLMPYGSLRINHFCKKYIYSDDRPFDGKLFLFIKVE